jgi:hypothetical protein
MKIYNAVPRAAAMLTIQTGKLMVRGLAPLRSDRLVGYCVCLRSSLSPIHDAVKAAPFNHDGHRRGF